MHTKQTKGLFGVCIIPWLYITLCVCVWSVVSFPLLLLVAFYFGVVFVFFGKYFCHRLPVVTLKASESIVSSSI